MATLAQLTAFRDKLLAARFSGVQSITDQNGEKVVYRTESEISRALAAVNSEIAAASRPTSNVVKFNSSKGL
jgi:hypothetical protein